jgi:hypothetical protein
MGFDATHADVTQCLRQRSSVLCVSWSPKNVRNKALWLIRGPAHTRTINPCDSICGNRRNLRID